MLKQLTELELDIATALQGSFMSQEKVILVLEYC